MAWDVKLDLGKCTGQAVCIAVCPESVFDPVLQDNKVVIADMDACTGCGACVRGCPEEALVVVNKETGEEIAP
ncbi:MAG: ferredoxin family protein [Candidatus Bathyarchaeia archaeon]